jgi:hypothetical protein
MSQRIAYDRMSQYAEMQAYMSLLRDIVNRTKERDQDFEDIVGELDDSFEDHENNLKIPISEIII